MERLRHTVTIVNSLAGGGDFTRALRVADSLASHGYSVEVVAWNRSRTSLPVRIAQNVTVTIYDHPTRGRTILSTLTGYALWWLFLSKRLLRSNPAFVHAQGLPSLLPVIPIRWLRGGYLIYDLIDFVADSFAWPPILAGLLGRFENRCLAFADAVLVVDPRKQELTLSNVRRLAVIMNCPADLRDRLRLLPRPAEFTVYYGGALYKERGLDLMCDAIKGLDRVRFVIAGPGPHETILKSRAHFQQNVELKGVVSETQSLELTLSSDVVYAFYDPRIPINRKAAPAKIYDAMMCGKPVLVNTEAILVAERIREIDCGLIVPYGDVVALREAVLWLRSHPSQAKEMGEAGRKAFERTYNWPAMEGKLISLYREIAADRPRSAE